MATETDRPKIKRKQYIVSKQFQLKYVGLILALMFLTAALCSYVMYYSAMLSMGQKLANVYPQGRLIAIVKMVNFRMLLSVILISPLVAVIGIFLSHKIAGPIYRIEKVLAGMAAGDLSNRIVLRKGDEMLSLADSINKLTESLKFDAVSQKERLARVLNEVDALKKAVSAGPKAAANVSDVLNMLEDDIAAFRQALDKYKM